MQDFPFRVVLLLIHCCFVAHRLVQRVRPDLIKRIKRVKSPFAWRVSTSLLNRFFCCITYKCRNAYVRITRETYVRAVRVVCRWGSFSYAEVSTCVRVCLRCRNGRTPQTAIGRQSLQASLLQGYKSGKL